jgi:hypothetical protein
MLPAIVDNNKVEIINLGIAIVCAVGAGWLSVTARVKAILISASHARAAMLAANEQLRDAQRDIVSLRRQLAQVIAENEELSGRLFLAPSKDNSEWEKSQSLLENAAERVDATILPTPAPAKPAKRKPIVIESNKLIFRKGPMELDPSDFESKDG